MNFDYRLGKKVPPPPAPPKPDVIAVASAARRAGHDAVIGYSKQKTGNPFLSEVFDVRERSYPDKFGSFDVWD